MRIKRIRLSLPAHLRHTAAHDARAMAEAMARELAGQPDAPTALRVDLPGQRQSGAVLATQAALGVRKGGGHGS